MPRMRRAMAASSVAARTAAAAARSRAFARRTRSGDEEASCQELSAHSRVATSRIVDGAMVNVS